MDQKGYIDFVRMTTFELAFNLATGKYTEHEKFEALKVIQERDATAKEVYLDNSSNVRQPEFYKEKTAKPPLKGSKSEKIFNLAMEGKSPQEAFEILNKKGNKVYYPEIYRVYKRYNKI